MGMGKVTTVALAIVVVAAGAIHLNTLANGFLADDRYLVLDNPIVEGDTPWSELFAKPWGGTSKNEFERRINATYYRPATLAFYRLERSSFGTRPSSFHAVSLLLHCLACALVFLIARRWLTETGSAAAGILFAVHAVHTEAVNSISYQTTLLAACLFFLGLLLHTASSRSPRRRPAGHISVVIVYALAALTKETAITLPAVLLLHDLLLRKKTLRILISPYYLCFGAVAVAYMMLRFFVLPGDGMDFFEGVSGLSKALTMAGVYGLYLKLLAWPIPLCPFYEWSILPPVSHPSVFAVFGVIAVVAYLGVTIRMTVKVAKEKTHQATRPSRTAFACFFLWLLPVTLLPVMHLVPFLIPAGERFVYVGSITLCLLFGMAVERAFAIPSRTLRTIFAIVTALYLLAMGTMTVVRNTDWKTDESLSRATLRDHPQSLNARITLTRLLLDRGDYEEALKHARIAVAAAPSVRTVRKLERAAQEGLIRGKAPPSRDP